MLSMAFHNAVTNFHDENSGTVSILHGEDKGVMDHSEPGSVKVSRSLPSVRTRLHRTLLGSWQSVEVPQSLYFANFERAEVSILLPFDSLRFEGKIFFTIVMGNEMLKATCRTKMHKVSTCSVKGNLCSLMLPAIYFLNLRTIHSGGKTLCRCYLCCQDV